MRRLPILGLVGLLAGATPSLAAAATPAACGLTGFVRAPGATCPPTLTAATGPHSQLLGGVTTWVFGGLIGDGVRDALKLVVSWASSGAGDALRVTASLIGTTTRPALGSTWFSDAYWRMTVLSAMLAVPFLFAAAIHAIVRSDLGLLGRAAFGYLPLAMLAVGIAAPLTALALSATDEMCSFVANAGGGAAATFLGHAATAITVAAAAGQDPFIVFLAAALTVLAALALWLELIVRDAAVDVVVLMLPLFFAAMVWPARRVWAIRAVELLVSLILAKFAIVAVLTLGGAAMGDAGSGVAALLTGATLVLLATFSPWALLRLLPLHEVAAAAAGGWSQPVRQSISREVDQLRSGDHRSAELPLGASFGDDSSLDTSGLRARPAELPRFAAVAEGDRHGAASPIDAPSTGDAGDVDAPVTPGAAPAPALIVGGELPADGGTGARGAGGAGAPGDVGVPTNSGFSGGSGGSLAAVGGGGGDVGAEPDGSGRDPRGPVPEWARPGRNDTPFLIDSPTAPWAEEAVSSSQPPDPAAADDGDPLPTVPPLPTDPVVPES